MIPSSKTVETNATTAGTSSNAHASLPHIGGPPGYVGSKSCQPCHQDQFTSWHRTFHRTMTQAATPEAVQADFRNVVLTNDGTRFTLSQRNREFWTRMERLVPDSAASVPAIDVPVAMVTGSHHMQVFWVPAGEGNAQIGFPFTWLIPEKRWVPRNSTFIRPPDLAHRSEMWNVVCSRCHTTGLEPRFDAASRSVDTRVGELGIACEACHGPGERHTLARQAERDSSRAITAETLRAEIVHPEKLDPGRASQVCGFCHSMKWIDQAEQWRGHGFRFRPGDDLDQTTPIIRPARVAENPGLASYLARNPDLLRDFFWSDGMIRVSGREYNGLIESPCFQHREADRKITCLSCHSMHKSDPDDLLSRNRSGHRACTQCHDRFRDPAQIVSHTRHQAGSSGSECYNCHMPHTTYGVLKAIRSHQISSPRVADDLATGRPNACNLCHLDQTVDWTARHLAQWFHQPRPDLAPAVTNTAHAVRLALSGDAGQRALLAWHFSWPPALQISGTNWIAPVLGQLLDDPYAAVRCVAERSLRAISDLTPTGYDFTTAPRNRAPASAVVLKGWTAAQAATGSLPSPTRVQPRDPTATQTALDTLAAQRDDRPIRLRE